MRDFAKASIVDLILRQLKRSHPELAPTGHLDPIRQATIAPEFKRTILDRIWHSAGPETLLLVGQNIREISYDPLWHAAIRTPDPTIVLDKWQRFEVFGHSQNRVRVTQTGKKHRSFQRYTIDGGTPTPAENLLICGMIIALLEEIGCVGLICEMPIKNGQTYPIRQQGHFSLPSNVDELVTQNWSILWADFIPQIGEERTQENGLEFTLPPACDAPTRKTVRAAIDLISFDVSRQWEIAALARTLGLSTRSLQRRFHEAGYTFSQLVRLVRIHDACRLLAESDASITAIGFCSGFSDSAQFSRDFRATMGMTPSAYRANC